MGASYPMTLKFPTSLPRLIRNLKSKAALAAACERLAPGIMRRRQWPSRQGVGRLERATLWALIDQTIDVVDAGSEDNSVDYDEQRKRRRDRRGRNRRDGISSAHDAMDYPWLAPGFGHEPAGDDRHEADPPSVCHDPQIPARVEQNAAPHQPGPDQRRRHHEEADR